MERDAVYGDAAYGNTVYENTRRLACGLVRLWLYLWEGRIPVIPVYRTLYSRMALLRFEVVGFGRRFVRAQEP
jgi:hypothetical protein